MSECKTGAEKRRPMLTSVPNRLMLLALGTLIPVLFDFLNSKLTKSYTVHYVKFIPRVFCQPTPAMQCANAPWH